MWLNTERGEMNEKDCFDDFIAGFGFGVGRVPLVAAITGGEDEGVAAIYPKMEARR